MSDCQSIYKPARWPSLEVQCSLPAGHKGFHQGLDYSWPDEDSPLALNPNRPLNPAGFRAWAEWLSMMFGLIGFVIGVLGFAASWLYHLAGSVLILIGLVFIFAGYKLWSRSLRI